MRSLALCLDGRVFRLGNLSSLCKVQSSLGSEVERGDTTGLQVLFILLCVYSTEVPFCLSLGYLRRAVVDNGMALLWMDAQGCVPRIQAEVASWSKTILSRSGSIQFVST
jgi:hypothetical protein